MPFSTIFSVIIDKSQIVWPNSSSYDLSTQEAIHIVLFAVEILNSFLQTFKNKNELVNIYLPT
jgi:hypothetical protein